LYQIKSDTNAINEEVFVKFPPVYEENNEGETEYKWLKFLFPKLSLINPNLGVPRPLDFYTDINALLTAKLIGKSFKQILLKYNSFTGSVDLKKKLDYYINLCGQWLKIFHNLTRMSEMKLLDDAFFRKIYAQLELLQSYGFPRDILMRINNLHQGIETFAIRHPMEIAGQHGDFEPSNIIINRDRVYVIDLSYNKKESIYNDIACFLVSLQTINPMSWYPVYDYMRIKHLKNAFVQSYFGHHWNPVHELFIEIYSLKHIIVRCQRHYEALNSQHTIFLKSLGIGVLIRLYSILIERKIRRIEECLNIVN
jgi:thiamine kinase-like enzyme